jgi:hypothetical protein
LNPKSYQSYADAMANVYFDFETAVQVLGLMLEQVGDHERMGLRKMVTHVMEVYRQKGFLPYSHSLYYERYSM